MKMMQHQNDRPSVMVTGGLGFIGTHLVDRFLEKGWRVDIVDSMVAAVTKGVEYERHSGLRVYRCSIEELLASGHSVAGYDLVVHAASLVGPAGILKHGGRLGFAMVDAAHAVIEACVAAKRRLVVFSSAEVYGRSGDLAESDALIVPQPYNVRIEYAIAKSLIEAMTLNSLHRGLEAIVVRPFNVTGPRQSRANGFVMPTFVQQAMSQQPLTVFGGGGQRRAFLSATDLSRFVADFAPAAFASRKGIFNVGNPDNVTSILDLADRIKMFCQSRSPITLVDGKSIHGALYEEAASVDKLPVLEAAANVGWQPAIGLDALIHETIHFYTHARDDLADELVA